MPWITDSCLFHTADNVLLSEDGRDTFLCDFGHAERLDNQGQSLSGSKGKHRVADSVKLTGNLSTSTF